MTVYYISQSGSDSADGLSPATAWRTIDKVNTQAAASRISSGDQILFAGGEVFTGGLYFGPGSGGTASSPIAIGSFGSGRATISAPSTKDGFFAYNAAGFRIANLNFQGAGASLSTKQGISFYNDLAGNVKLPFIEIDSVSVSGFKNGLLIGGWNGGSGYRDVRITNVVANDNLEAGISTYGYPLSAAAPNYAHANVTVANCLAYNNFGDPNSGRPSGNGIVLGGVNGGVIERSVAHDNGKNNLTNAGPVGIWTYDSNSIIIQYNESYRNQTSGTGDGDGFDLDINVTNSILQYNYSHDNDGAGFLVYADATHPNSNNTVRYNISENDGKKLSGYGGIVIGGTVSEIDVYGNTVYVSSAASDPAALRVTTWGGTPRNLRVRNNLFYSNQSATGSVKLLDSPAEASYLFQGNNYFDSSNRFAIRWGQSSYGSLSAWLTAATSQERVNGGIVGKNLDPQLTAPGAGGTIGNAQLLESALTAYKLQPGSPLINGGLNLPGLFGTNPGNRDFYGDGIPIDGAFDIGADEVSSSSPPPPPPPPPTPLFTFTVASPTTLHGLSVQTNDIIGFTGNGFVSVLKGNDVGLAGISIDGFNALSESELLISLRTAASIQGVTYGVSDIVKLSKQSNGSYLAAMYFDGSDVGLTKSSEAIDAFAIDPVTGELLISTRGSVSVSGASGYGEDILAFKPTQLGNTTTGTWRTVFDGSDVGLSGSAENITALGLQATTGGTILYLATNGNFSAGGIGGDNKDVFTFTPSQLGTTTQGVFGKPLFFDGSAWGLTSALAGLDV